MFVNVIDCFSECPLRISFSQINAARRILDCFHLVSRISKQNNCCAVQMQKYIWLPSSEVCMMTNHLIFFQLAAALSILYFRGRFDMDYKYI